MPSHEPNKYRDKLSSILPEIDFDAGWDAVEVHLDQRDKDDRKTILWWRTGLLLAALILSAVTYILLADHYSLANVATNTTISTDRTISNTNSIGNTTQNEKPTRSTLTTSAPNNATAIISDAEITAPAARATAQALTTSIGQVADLSGKDVQRRQGDQGVQNVPLPRKSAAKEYKVTTTSDQLQLATSAAPHGSIVIATQEHTGEDTRVTVDRDDQTSILSQAPLLPLSGIPVTRATLGLVPAYYPQSPAGSKVSTVWSINHRLMASPTSSQINALEGYTLQETTLLSTVTSLQYNRSINDRVSWLVGVGYQVQRQRQRASGSVSSTRAINTSDGIIVIDDIGNVISSLPGTISRETTVSRDIQQYSYIHTALIEAGIAVRWSPRWHSELSALLSIPVSTDGDRIDESLALVELVPADISTTVIYHANLLYRVPFDHIKLEAGLTAMTTAAVVDRPLVGIQLRMHW